MSDGDFAGDLGEAGRPRGRLPRRPRERRDGAAAEAAAAPPTFRPWKIPDYILPLVLLFLAVMPGLWFLLRRMNEPPPGQILHRGRSPRTGPATEPRAPTGPSGRVRGDLEGNVLPLPPHQEGHDVPGLSSTQGARQS